MSAILPVATPEQLERMEKTRLVALERKRIREEEKRASVAAPFNQPNESAALTQEQRDHMEKNRLMALERKRKFDQDKGKSDALLVDQPNESSMLERGAAAATQLKGKQQSLLGSVGKGNEKPGLGSAQEWVKEKDKIFFLGLGPKGAFSMAFTRTLLNSRLYASQQIHTL